MTTRCGHPPRMLQYRATYGHLPAIDTAFLLVHITGEASLTFLEKSIVSDEPLPEIDDA